MKNDGSQIKEISGLKEGVKPEITPIADYMPDFKYFNQRDDGGK